jgi:hypothetical protein
LASAVPVGSIVPVAVPEVVATARLASVSAKGTSASITGVVVDLLVIVAAALSAVLVLDSAAFAVDSVALPLGRMGSLALGVAPS